MKAHDDFSFVKQGKFALLAINSAFSDVGDSALQLSDGTWVLPAVPVPDLSTWSRWIGSIRWERLKHANLVLVVQEKCASPEILDAVHKRLACDLTRLFYVLHLSGGLEYDGADLLCGYSDGGVTDIRRLSRMDTFYQSNGYRRSAMTKRWLENGLNLRAGIVAMEADKTQFRRVVRGLNTLFKGLKETGQDRIHQFVRSLEALVLPDTGSTKKQFAHRCQTFARHGDDTRALLLEAFDLRSDTEHLNAWDKSVQDYPATERDAVCWHRTRQIEQLACAAYTRLLADSMIRAYFRSDNAIAAFWKRQDDERRALWGTPIDITTEPLVHEYNQWGRAAP